MIIDDEAREQLDKIYLRHRRLIDDKIIAMKQIVLEFVLCCGVSLVDKGRPYKYRYHYLLADECLKDFNRWDGSGDPLGNWQRRTGLGFKTAYNPNYDFLLCLK